MKPILVTVFSFIALGLVQAADLNTLATAAGGTFDAASGAVIIKSNKDLTPAQLSDLASAPGIKKLVIEGSKLATDGVAVLPKFKEVESLKLDHTMVNKVADLKVLATTSTLEELSLGGSDFGDEGLAALQPLKNLKALHLGHVGRSPKTAFTAEGLKALAGLPKLETATLYLLQPDEAMIPVLASLKTLKDLKLGGISSDFLAKAKAAMPQAKVAAWGKTTDAK